MAKILVLHGPNLNLLGTREVKLYGQETLNTVNDRLKQKAEAHGHELGCFQSNAEHELIQVIHEAGSQQVAAIIINPAAFTHTSIALRDALLAVNIPFVEVHITNIEKREVFRKHSFFSDIAQGTVSGFGTYGYDLALEAIFHSFHQQARQ